jgi:hypothetical protein
MSYTGGYETRAREVLTKLFSILLSAGADVGIRDKSGETAEDYVRHQPPGGDGEILLREIQKKIKE